MKRIISLICFAVALFFQNAGLAMAPQCKGTAKSTGKTCRLHTNNANGFCRLHQPGMDKLPQLAGTTDTKEAPQCKGTTQKGARCRKHTKNPNGFCGFHQPGK